MHTSKTTIPTNLDTVEVLERHAEEAGRCIDAYHDAGYKRTAEVDMMLGIHPKTPPKIVGTRYKQLQEIMNSSRLLLSLCVGFRAGKFFGQLDENLNKWVKCSLYSRQVLVELETFKIWLEKKTIRDAADVKYITEEHGYPGSQLQAELIEGGYEDFVHNPVITVGGFAASVMKRNPLIYITHVRGERIDKELRLKAKMPHDWDRKNILARHNMAGYRLLPIRLDRLDDVCVISDHETVRKTVEKFATNNSHMSIDVMIAKLTT